VRIIGGNPRIVKYVSSTRVEHCPQKQSSLFDPQNLAPIKVFNYVHLEKSNVVEVVGVGYLVYWL
jgi:hypothetical protein